MEKDKISYWQERVTKFARERDWEQFHNPKDICLALMIEVAEIMEHFRFKTDAEIIEYLKTHRQEVSHELADVMHFLLRLAEVTDIDLVTAMEEKIKISETKYPVHLVKGKKHKYTHYQDKV